MTDSNHTPGSGSPSEAPDPRRWLALGVIAIAQLMIMLDASIVNIALPSAQQDLGISDADRQWVVTAYTLAFGGLLLLGGRIADFIGPQADVHHRPARLRRRVRARRHRLDRRAAVRRPRPAGCVRRAAGAGRPVADRGHLHRAQGAGPRVRRVRRDLRRRRRDRPDPRRRADRVRLVALVPGGQRADRARRGGWRPCRSCTRARPPATRATTFPAPSSRPLGLVSPGLRLHRGRQAQGPRQEHRGARLDRPARR